MDDTNNINESLCRNNNNNNQEVYPSLNNLNHQIVEINRHQD